MPAEVANGLVENPSLANGDLKPGNPSDSSATAAKKSRETERRRRRRKQKKNKQNATQGNDSDTDADDRNGPADDSSKENSDPQKVALLIYLYAFVLRSESDEKFVSSNEEFGGCFLIVMWICYETDIDTQP